MRWAVGVVLLVGLSPLGAEAQASPIVLVVDAGGSSVSVPRLSRTIAERLGRPLVRLTDPLATMAEGTLTIAHGAPDRWVVVYEEHGLTTLRADRVGDGQLVLARLAELAAEVVGERSAPSADDDWFAGRILQDDEIVDPFDPPRAQPRPRPLRVRQWTELIDPFDDSPPPRHADLVWSEVVDPWGE